MKQLKYQVGDIVLKDGKTWLVLATAASPYGLSLHEGYDYIIENEVSRQTAQVKEQDLDPPAHDIGVREGAGDMG